MFLILLCEIVGGVFCGGVFSGIMWGVGWGGVVGVVRGTGRVILFIICNFHSMYSHPLIIYINH